MSSLARKIFGVFFLVLLLGLCFLGVRNFASATPSSADPGSSQSVAATFSHHLVVLDHDTLKPYDDSALKNVKYFAFYHSASWCPPCRIFTPKLVKFYNDFKPKHPDFELIFVNHDADADDMLAYMKDDAMPWPAVRFDDIDGTGANDSDPQASLPDLILVNASGTVLSDTYQGMDFMGPDKVLDDIQSMVH